MRIVRSVVGAPLLAAAQARISRSDYAGALKSIELLSRVLGCKLGSIGLPIRANIISLQAAYWLSNVEIAERSAHAAMSQAIMNISKSDSSISRYTAAYLFDFMEFAAGRFPDRSDYFLGEAGRLAGMRLDFNEAELPVKLTAEMPLGARMSGRSDDKPA